MQVFGEDALLNISVEREASGETGDPFGFLASLLRVCWRRRHCGTCKVDICAAGSLAGAIRIRAKTQGIALSLGDRVTAKQKGK